MSDRLQDLKLGRFLAPMNERVKTADVSVSLVDAVKQSSHRLLAPLGLGAAPKPEDEPPLRLHATSLLEFSNSRASTPRRRHSISRRCRPFARPWACNTHKREALQAILLACCVHAGTPLVRRRSRPSIGSS